MRPGGGGPAVLAGAVTILVGGCLDCKGSGDPEDAGGDAAATLDAFDPSVAQSLRSPDGIELGIPAGSLRRPDGTPALGPARCEVEVLLGVGSREFDVSASHGRSC